MHKEEKLGEKIGEPLGGALDFLGRHLFRVAEDETVEESDQRKVLQRVATVVDRLAFHNRLGEQRHLQPKKISRTETEKK